jgi:hypothetical protein
MRGNDSNQRARIGSTRGFMGHLSGVGLDRSRPTVSGVDHCGGSS